MAHGPRRAGSCTPCTCRRSLGQTRWGQRSCWRWPYRSCRSWLLPLHRYIVDVQQRYFCADFCQCRDVRLSDITAFSFTNLKLSAGFNFKVFPGTNVCKKLQNTFPFQDIFFSRSLYRRENEYANLAYPNLAYPNLACPNLDYIWRILIWPILIWTIFGLS